MPPRIPLSRPKPRKPEPAAANPVPVPIERSMDFCRVFVDGKRLPGNIRVNQAMEIAEQHENAFVWLSLKSPSVNQMERLAQIFSIDDLIVDDVVDAHQRPKIERYDEQLFMVVRAVRYRDDEEVADAREIISTGEVQIVTGQNFAVTIRHNAALPDLTAQLEAEEELVLLGPSAVAWIVSDYLVDHYLRVAEYLSQDVDELENEVFTPKRQINIDKIYNYKREILEMRHAIDPLGPALRNGLTNNKDLVRKALRSYFRDVQDNATIASDRIAGFDERLSSLLDASVAKVTMQQNADMRTISAVVGMAAVPTLIAGIYGMNFENMPELSWKYGYLGALLVMLTAMGLMLWWFRKNNWL